MILGAYDPQAGDLTTLAERFGTRRFALKRASAGGCAGRVLLCPQVMNTEVEEF